MYGPRPTTNGMRNNFLPYLEVQRKTGRPLKFLIDTGVNKNYITPELVSIAGIGSGPWHKIQNVSGAHVIDKFTYMNPFINITKGIPSQKFFLFKFHDFFDGLVGFESLRSIGAIIDTRGNTLTINNAKIRLKKKFPNNEQLNFQANETIIKQFPVRVEEGDFLVEDDIIIERNVVIPAGVYSAVDSRITVPVINNTNTQVKVLIDREALFMELNNFEEISLETLYKIETHAKENFCLNKIRHEHLNKEKRYKLFKLLNQFRDVFYNTNAIGHRINTVDELPIYSKTYHYPFCHREGVQQQVSKMLEQGVIRPSDSPHSSLLWVVPKKLDASGQRKWRLVIDYR